MSASQSAPAASDLHDSIDQLLAEAEKRGRAAADADLYHLTTALQTALDDIVNSQQVLARTADVLRTALGINPTAPVTAAVIEAAVVPDPTIKEEIPGFGDGEPDPKPVPERGDHEMDVIAHHASIGTASGLQAMLRARSEVKSAQTREFVNGELRLQLHLRNSLDIGALNAWLSEHTGALVTQTDSVIEIRFAG